MDARLVRAAFIAAAFLSLGASYRTANFIVNAGTPQIAQQVGKAAEDFRRDLAIEWLGKPMPNWSQPCPITVEAADHLGAGGATSFVFNHGEVFDWRMTIQGPLNRILDSVLPHEVTHTIFASHFRCPLPRWADEGGCTTVEHPSERRKQQQMLITFLQTGRGIAFNEMFAMKEYPRDILPLYSQGHSLASFLIAQGGKRKYLNYLADGMEREQWIEATKRHYNFNDLAALQTTWLDWVRKGSPPLATPPSDTTLVAHADVPRPAPKSIYRAQSEDPTPGPITTSAAQPTSQNFASSQPGWRSAGTKQTPTSSVAASELVPIAVPMRNEVTRPQGPQQLQQTVIEWSRPSTPLAPPTATSSVYGADGRMLR